MSRRIQLALAIGLTALACSMAGAAEWSHDDAAHLLRRAGFGGTPAQIVHLQKLGRDAAIEFLLTGKTPAGAERPLPAVKLPEFEFDNDLDMTGRNGSVQSSLFELQRIGGWWIDRMARTDRPLEEKMTLFWHGIFTCGIMEARSAPVMFNHLETERKFALGNYKDLARQMIHDPAEIRYLNNDQNVRGKPNENLARELMELFTMGQDQGYTEKDIPEVARALTGLTVTFRSVESEFRPFLHDDGPKTIFGKTGNYMPDDVIDLIFDRPEPSVYLAKRMWKFFVGTEPTKDDVSAIASALKDNKWEVAPALRVLFARPGFYDSAAKFAVIKSPAELIAMTLRLLDEPSDVRMDMATTFTMRAMGEDLFQPPNVRGWPGGEQWITSTNVFTRYNAAMMLARGNMGMVDGPFAGAFAGNGRQAPTTRPARPPIDPATMKHKDPYSQEARNAFRLALLELERQELADKIRAKVTALPAPAALDQRIVPATMFAALGQSPKPAALLDAVVDRFVQRPLSDEKKSALTKWLGDSPIKLGDAESDQRVRELISYVVATPEYQAE